MKPIRWRPHIPSRKKGWTLDHFWPKSSGRSLRSNKVLACKSCNLKKGSKEPTLRQRILFYYIQRLKITLNKALDIIDSGNHKINSLLTG